MPIYEWRCTTCGALHEVVRSVVDYDKPATCCGPMERHYTPHMVVADIQPYRSTITGERIRGRAHHRSHLKQHGCIEVGNEPIRPRKTVDVPRAHEDVKKAYHEVRAKRGSNR